MADESSSGDLAVADDGLAVEGVPPKRRRRGLRITLLSLASVIVLLGAAAAGAFITAPTQLVDGFEVLEPAQSAALWSAVKDGTIAAFAEKRPSSVTPTAP
jgi:hypothetical protein